MAVILETSLGDMTVDLLVEERPKCCKNFLKLCKVKYYNFCLFHSVQKNLVAQTGDPTGTGRGGESLNGLLYGEQARYFDMELVPRIKHKSIGTVSMVNNGGNMHGSQFFFTLREDLEYLDGNHTVFGEVSEGLDVLEKINETICDEDHRPYKDIRIFHTVILDDPFDDPPGLEVPDKSPEPTKEQLDSGRIGVYEAIDDNEGKTKAEIAEMMEEQEAKANAQLLEVIGDLPDADMAPPENVLFVCKLNPVTSEEDLELIFSRFGVIKSCEVIKDQKTGESLQYAFIEFEKQEDCERAYFKMDNVLIDDRRIHVDFSQSVAKVKWKGKGKGVQTFDKKDDSVPSLKLKEQKKTHSNYDLVYDMDDERDRTEKNSRKSKKKSSHNEDRSYSSQKHKKHRSRSKSPARILKKRSSSPTYSKHRERSRSCSPSYRKQKDRSRDRSYKKDSHRRERSPEGRYRHKHRDRR